MVNSVISEHCKNVRRCGSKISIEELKNSFDEFVKQLNICDNSDEKLFLIKQILKSLSGIPQRNKFFSDSQLVNHQFFLILRDKILIDYLRRIPTEENLNDEILLNVSLMLMNICYNINHENINSIKNLFLNKELIDEVADRLNEMSKSGKYLNNHLIIRSMNNLLLSYKHFRRYQITSDEYKLINPIVINVIECLCSSYASDIIQSLEKNFVQKLNDNQMFYLDTMPLYLQWYSSDYRDTQNYIQILNKLLNLYTNWLTNCPADSFVECNSKLATMIRHLSCFLIRPIESENLYLISQLFYNDYTKLISYWTNVLSSIVNLISSSSIKINCIFATRIVVQNFYNFTLHLNILNFMKKIPNLIQMLLILTDIRHDEIQLNVYRSLGKMMIEADIKTMANPDKIASVYIDYIQNTMDDPKNLERFYSLLKSLKNFVQHDQVKSELIKQNALPLLIKCVEESGYDPINVQLIALEILLALAFNSDACLQLKMNLNFLKQIRIFANNNTNKENVDQLCLQRVAEMLLWKLEKEEEAISKVHLTNNYQYDIMISYSHKNQQICLDIRQQLINDGFRVWIDKDCLRGSTMVGIANAIENSQYVLICMSNYYKQSVYCQSEAHYAFERGCRLIPIVIEQNYKPDGWLGIIVSGKIYIDFTIPEFTLAYQNLKQEINQQKHQQSSLSTTKSDTNQQLNITPTHPKSIQLDSQSIIELPKNIIEWTDDHVKSFLFQMELGSTILPLCPRMNGHHLLHLYQMCLINRESMYQSLKFELNQKHQILLPIADYIRFIEQIKSYIPPNDSIYKYDQSSSISFTFCTLL